MFSSWVVGQSVHFLWSRFSSDQAPTRPLLAFRQRCSVWRRKQSCISSSQCWDSVLIVMCRPMKAFFKCLLLNANEHLILKNGFKSHCGRWVCFWVSGNINFQICHLGCLNGKFPGEGICLVNVKMTWVNNSFYWLASIHITNRDWLNIRRHNTAASNTFFRLHLQLENELHCKVDSRDFTAVLQASSANPNANISFTRWETGSWS